MQDQRGPAAGDSEGSGPLTVLLPGVAVGLLAAVVCLALDGGIWRALAAHAVAGSAATLGVALWRARGLMRLPAG